MSEDHLCPIAPPITQVQIACPGCQYNLTGMTIGSACPECGLIIGRGALGLATTPTSGKATAALVLGILSIIGCSFYGLPSVPCGIIAIVLARKVNQDIIQEKASPASAGLARAGMVCGTIGLILGGLMLLLLTFMFLAMALR